MKALIIGASAVSAFGSRRRGGEPIVPAVGRATPSTKRQSSPRWRARFAMSWRLRPLAPAGVVGEAVNEAANWGRRVGPRGESRPPALERAAKRRQAIAGRRARKTRAARFHKRCPPPAPSCLGLRESSNFAQESKESHVVPEPRMRGNDGQASRPNPPGASPRPGAEVSLDRTEAAHRPRPPLRPHAQPGRQYPAVCEI